MIKQTAVKRKLPLITFRDATLQIGDRRILEHVDWEIRSGERWAIIGMNGSGKSTLARALCSAVTVVGGEIIHHFKNFRRVQGFGNRYPVPDDFIAHVSFDDQKRLVGNQSSYYQSRWNSGQKDDAMTALELLVNSERSRARRKEFSIEDGPMKIARQLDIGYLLDRKLPYLSNGEMRKLLIARALLRSPLLLILDEPFAGLDHRSREALKKIISNFMKGMEGMIYVTSNPNEIPAGITRALWLENGKIIGAGETAAVVEYASRKAPSVRKAIPLKRSDGIIHRKNSAPAPALLEMNNVSVTYGDVKALTSVSWAVLEGQHWALLGPNGSGKSTLLSLITADNPQAYSNDIRLFGRKRGSGESIWQIKRKIGLVSPEMQIHYQKQTTVFQVVCSGFFDSIGLYHQCSPRQQRAASAVIDILGLAEIALKSMDRLSAGQQRMALVARALVKKPKLLILDEPCQGLDPENRASILDAVELVGRSGTGTIIYVTHRPDEIPPCINHVLELRNGRTLRQGKTFLRLA
jgi:molybdate transport system ATP-binding protein